MARHTEHDQRREELQRIHAALVENNGYTSTDAVHELAERTGRSEWTVWAWISNRSVGYTIPADTLELLKLRLGM